MDMVDVHLKRGKKVKRQMRKEYREKEDEEEEGQGEGGEGEEEVGMVRAAVLGTVAQSPLPHQVTLSIPFQ